MVARREIVDAGPDLLDDARAFVAADDREPPGRPEPEVLVGVAQARVVEAHVDLAGPRWVDLELDQLPVGAHGEQCRRRGRSHRFSSLVPACAVRPDSCSGNSSA